jgi:hypothetical protein
MLLSTAAVDRIQWALGRRRILLPRLGYRFGRVHEGL